MTDQARIATGSWRVSPSVPAGSLVLLVLSIPGIGALGGGKPPTVLIYLLAGARKPYRAGNAIFEMILPLGG